MLVVRMELTGQPKKNDSLASSVLVWQQLTTFGDIILIASSLAGQSKEGVQMVDQKRSDPVWDRALDG